MSKVPVITSPCPLRWRESPQAGRDFCGHCQRRVHNLDGMNQVQREAFLAGCTGEVCVSYTIKRSRWPALAAGLGLASGLAGGVQAQDEETTYPTTVTGPQCEELGDVDHLENMVILGGTLSKDALRWVDESEVERPAKPTLPEIDAIDWLPTPPEAE